MLCVHCLARIHTSCPCSMLTASWRTMKVENEASHPSNSHTAQDGQHGRAEGKCALTACIQFPYFHRLQLFLRTPLSVRVFYVEIQILNTHPTLLFNTPNPQSRQHPARTKAYTPPLPRKRYPPTITKPTAVSSPHPLPSAASHDFPSQRPPTP